MAGQGLERREVLRILALAASASGYPGFHRWSFACEHSGSGLLQVKRPSYTPRFFTADEYATVERLVELIIPSDGSPGAREAGVSEFVDFMVSSDPGVQYRFRYGLTWLDAHAQNLHGNDPRRFVTNRFGQAHDVKNLFVCDASVFLGCSDKTTTLSILAFSLRTSEYLVDELRRGEL